VEHSRILWNPSPCSQPLRSDCRSKGSRRRRRTKVHIHIERQSGGAGPSSPTHFPLFGGTHDVARVTEGELKVDVATVLSGTLTVGLPGDTNYRTAVSLLRELEVSTVLLSIDADARKTRPVARALDGMAHAFSEAGLTV